MSKFETWIACCDLRKIADDSRYHCKAAVWADSYATFCSRLSDHIKPKGYSLIWAEECYTVTQYLLRHNNPRTIAPLTRAVHPHHLV